MKVLAACHLHSRWSYDGSWEIADLAAALARRGYRVALMTEHDRGWSRARQLEHREACARASSEKILVTPGIEYSDAENVVHVLVWGDVPFLGENVPTGKLLEAVRAANGVAALAHPTRREAWRVIDPSWLDGLAGIEVWNRKTDGWSPSGDAPQLLTRPGITPFAGLDFHTRKQWFPLAMALDVAGEVTEASVVDCLRSGRCQAQAFGLALDDARLRALLPACGAAERCRRTAAGLWRAMRRSSARKAEAIGGKEKL